jgi:hypothetical protein
MFGRWLQISMPRIRSKVLKPSCLICDFVESNLTGEVSPGLLGKGAV